MIYHQMGRYGHESYCLIEIHSSIPGTYIIEATTPHLPVAVGALWFRYSSYGDSLEVLNIYVDEVLRRKGIGRLLIRNLAEKAISLRIKKLYTGSGTPKYGKPFMLATGWKEAAQGWFYLIRDNGD